MNSSMPDQGDPILSPRTIDSDAIGHLNPQTKMWKGREVTTKSDISTFFHSKLPQVNSLQSKSLPKVTHSVPITKNAATLLKSASHDIMKKPHLVQIPVLHQHIDNTGSGFENCGYHAAKNTLCLLSSLHGNFDKNTFLDNDLFQEFYDRYCQPVLGKTEKGAKDATVPILREIAQNFMKDPNPSAKLKPLQVALKDSLLTNTGIFSAMPNESLDLDFGFFDYEGFIDACKLYDFASDPGPKTITCPIGDSSTGHWYAMSFFKDKQDNITMMGCDSLDNEQRGGASPLGKLGMLFQKTFDSPQDFLKSALTSFAETLAARGDWLTQEGQPLDTKDGEILLELANSTSIVEESLLATAVMLQHNWAKSDITTLLLLDKTSRLIHFFAAFLPEGHPQYTQVQNAASALKQNMDMDKSITSMLEKAQNESTTASQNPTVIRGSKLTQATFGSMQILYDQRSVISQEKDSFARELLAQNMTGAGVEAGFITGKLPQDAQKQLESRTHTLLIAFQKAKTLDKLDDFYMMMAKGDPCLTARMGRVEEYLSTLLSLGDLSQDLLTESIMKLSDTAISTLLSETINDDEELDRISKDQIDANQLSQYFEKFAKTSEAQPFKDYLVREGFAEKDKDINWKEVTAKLMASPQFTSMLNRGKELARPFI